MPVNGTRVTMLAAYALPMPPQTFTAKAAALSEVSLTTMYDHRAFRRRRGMLTALMVSLKGLTYARSR